MRPILVPALLLAAILTASALNCRAMVSETERWQEQLQSAEEQAAAGSWGGARDALARSYADWSRRQTYLHVVAEHQAVDGAEAMYRRGAAFAAAEEPSEFRAEMEDLKNQLRLLAEMERFSIKNIL